LSAKTLEILLRLHKNGQLTVVDGYCEGNVASIIDQISAKNQALGTVKGEQPGEIPQINAAATMGGRDLILATHVLLEEAAIAHTPMRGSISRGPSGAVLTPHWWIDLADGKRIDFRARQGLDHESGIPSGIFDPAAWPDVAYQGAPVMDIPPVDATRGALDVDWLTLSAAVRAAVARPGGAETAR